MHPFKMLGSIAIVTSMSACASFTPKEVAVPTDLTIDKAMESVGLGFNLLRKELAGNKIGVFACSVDINLNVTANASQGGKLVLDASLRPPLNTNVGTPPGVSVQAEQNNTSDATRGNTISIRLVNPACLPDGTLGASNPAGIGIIYEGLGGKNGPFVLSNP